MRESRKYGVVSVSLTEAQYARERLGVSVSSLKAKRVLASRAARVSELAIALSTGRIGYEAAYLLSRVVTPSTAREWIDRAERRTVKHLREEVDAAELLIRMGQAREQRPLDEESLDALFELERSILSGDWVGRDRDSTAGDGRRSEMPTDGQTSGAVSRHHRQKFGRVTLRFCVTEKTLPLLSRARAGVRARERAHLPHADEFSALSLRKLLPYLAAGAKA